MTEENTQMATNKQTELPAEGFQRPKIPELDEKGDDYRLLRDKRMDLAKKESEAKKALIACMQSHGQTTYIYTDDDGTDRKIVIEPKVNAKVSKIKAVDPDDDTDLQVQ